MASEQDKIAKSGGGAAADSGARGAGQTGETGAGGGQGGSADAGAAGAGGGGAGGAGSRGTPGGDNGPAGGGNLPPSSVAESAAASVKGCGDPDKVARQLCEAATQEADPFLRAALWDEYNQYKKILARQ